MLYFQRTMTGYYISHITIISYIMVMTTSNWKKTIRLLRPTAYTGNSSQSAVNCNRLCVYKNYQIAMATVYTEIYIPLFLLYKIMENIMLWWSFSAIFISTTEYRNSQFCIQSAGYPVPETLGSNPAFCWGRQHVSFRFENHLHVPERQNQQ